ncbi:MAG: pirin family protein [Thermostichales cyanobacterium BF4_bins_65]
MLAVRRSQERGHLNWGWLDTYHSFSFGSYYDPAHMGFRSLRVINDDTIAPGKGFGMHGHQDMEILTYVLSGSLEHRDSLGTGAVIRAGEIQRMSAGTGIYHSELNASDREPVRLLQIWILPAQVGLAPSYEQKSTGLVPGQLQLIASPDGRGGTVTVHQDVFLSAAQLQPGDAVTYNLPEGRYGWIQVARGELLVAGQHLNQGDGLAVSGIPELLLSSSQGSEFLVFDLA